MPNPFETQFDSECQDCGDMIDEGQPMFADKGEFICYECAEERDVICECGNYKKSEFATCFNCKDKK